jgi:lysophospholipase L1-like esterase
VQALAAEISVQALAGAGLTQNADAARAWEEGKLTMAELFNRTLQTSPTPWNSLERRQPDLVVISLGGNDFNHQKGHTPTNVRRDTEKLLCRVPGPVLLLRSRRCDGLLCVAAFL